LHDLDHEFEVNPLSLQVNIDGVAYIPDEEVLEWKVNIPFDSNGMRCVDRSLECNDLPCPLPVVNILVVLTIILFIPIHYFKFILGLSFFYPLFFLIVIVVNVLYEQISWQLHEGDEVLTVDIPPLLIKISLGDLLLQLAVRKDLHHVRTPEQIPLQDPIDHDLLCIPIPGHVVIPHPS